MNFITALCVTGFIFVLNNHIPLRMWEDVVLGFGLTWILLR